MSLAKPENHKKKHSVFWDCSQKRLSQVLVMWIHLTSPSWMEQWSIAPCY